LKETGPNNVASLDPSEESTLKSIDTAKVSAAMSDQVSSIQAWGVAVRPRSLLLAIGPVLAGASTGYLHAGSINLVVALLACGAALLMQVITNLQNDVGYTARGGEGIGARIGLPRATSQGWLSIRQVRIAIFCLSAVAIGLGVALVTYRGWPVLVIGAASLLAALAYMGGPVPIAYTPFGELTVFVFFGLVTVLGTAWLLTGSVSVMSILASVSIGCLAAAALAVNNHRDIEHDRLVGRHTFAVMFGESASRTLFSALLLCSFLSLTLMGIGGAGPLLLLPILLVPVAWRLHRDFVCVRQGKAYNEILFRTFRLELWFAGLLSVGALLTSLQF